MRSTLQEYPLPSLHAPSPASDEDRRKLASLGYVASEVRPVVRKDAPRPADMAFLFETLERANSLFIRRQYAAVVPLLKRVLDADPKNLEAMLHLASSYSQLGRGREAVETFHRAEGIAPESDDVRTYLALHYVGTSDWQNAIPLVDAVLAKEPDRLPALEALAVIRARQGRMEEALRVRRRIFTLRPPAPAELLQMAGMETSLGQTAAAIDSLEQMRAMEGPKFAYDLQLGVLYQAEGRLDAAKQALDRVPAASPAYPMALYKRAQISVMLGEPDRQARVEMAREHANAAIEKMIESDPMLSGY
jgi:tetratricopeptide (TPR) repeat protein